MFLFTLYLLDADSWTSKIGSAVRNLGFIVVALSAVVFFISGALANPEKLVLLYTVGIPAWFITTKHFFYRKVVFRDYVSWLTGPLLVAGIACIMYWGFWISLHKLHEWTPRTKVMMAEHDLEWKFSGDDNSLNWGVKWDQVRFLLFFSLFFFVGVLTNQTRCSLCTALYFISPPLPILHTRTTSPCAQHKPQQIYNLKIRYRRSRKYMTPASMTETMRPWVLGGMRRQAITFKTVTTTIKQSLACALPGTRIFRI